METENIEQPQPRSLGSSSGSLSRECPSVRDLHIRFGSPRNANEEHQASLSNMDKLALAVTAFVGSMPFFILVVVWTILWLSWNAAVPKDLQFDPYPGFVLWLFISNVIQIFLMPLIIIGQNVQSNHAEIQVQADIDVARKAETGIEAALIHLEAQSRQLTELLQKFGQSQVPQPSPRQ